jgi:sterol desaturase/sphingolipid hydroxylase (fatty acid hydroxylase superfamily)
LSNWITYWSHIPSSHRSLILVCGLLLFWLLEGSIPLWKTQYPRYKHAGVNLFFTLTTILVNFAFAFAIVRYSLYAEEHQKGLLYLVNMPTWLFVIAGLMLMDLISAWLIHWIEHRTRFLWKFHTIHHIDQHVDVTTANRHHPVESVFRAIFTLLAVIVSGAPIWLVMLYQSLSVVFSQFNHANISLSHRFDRVLSWIIISPDMHKVHHHYQQPFTDSNYGNIFSLWDRLFGTFLYLRPQDIVYGLDTHMPEGEKDRISNLLEVPFQPYRSRSDIGSPSLKPE